MTVPRGGEEGTEGSVEVVITKVVEGSRVSKVGKPVPDVPLVEQEQEGGNRFYLM
jgi:hypothetical protein